MSEPAIGPEDLPAIRTALRKLRDAVAARLAADDDDARLAVQHAVSGRPDGLLRQLAGRKGPWFAPSLPEIVQAALSDLFQGLLGFNRLFFADLSRTPNVVQLLAFLDGVAAALKPTGLQEDAAALDALREAIRKKGKKGKKAKSDDLLKNCGVGRQRGLNALRQLQSLGEYNGFPHKPHRRRQ